MLEYVDHHVHVPAGRLVSGIAEVGIPHGGCSKPWAIRMLSERFLVCSLHRLLSQFSDSGGVRSVCLFAILYLSARRDSGPFGVFTMCLLLATWYCIYRHVEFRGIGSPLYDICICIYMYIYIYM